MRKSSTIFNWIGEWNTTVPTKLSLLFILLITLLAIIGPLIANEKPYYSRLEGKNYFPLFSGINEATLSNLHPAYSPVDWKKTKFENILYAPIPYSHFTVDLDAGRFVSPFHDDPDFRFRHWLGTDVIGRDVMAGMIRGCRISLLVGFGSMLLALLFGIPLGSLAAYWGNNGWRLSWLQSITLLVTFLILIYIISLPVDLRSKLISFLFISLLSVVLIFISGKIVRASSRLPLDKMVMGIVSIIDSFPGLFIILIILVIIPTQGWLVVTLVIALLRWPVIARYIRAEVYKMKELNYIKAVQVLNIPHNRILMHHIIPYAIRPVLISFIFGVSSAILAESSLSFLGIGIPVEELNWGKLLSQSRNHFDAWWLVLFPGAAIFFTLLSLYTIGNALEKNFEGESQRTKAEAVK